MFLAKWTCGCFGGHGVFLAKSTFGDFGWTQGVSSKVDIRGFWVDIWGFWVGHLGFLGGHGVFGGKWTFGVFGWTRGVFGKVDIWVFCGDTGVFGKVDIWGFWGDTGLLLQSGHLGVWGRRPLFPPKKLEANWGRARFPSVCMVWNLGQGPYPGPAQGAQMRPRGSEATQKGSGSPGGPREPRKSPRLAQESQAGPGRARGRPGWAQVCSGQAQDGQGMCWEWTDSPRRDSRGPGDAQGLPEGGIRSPSSTKGCPESQADAQERHEFLNM